MADPRFVQIGKHTFGTCAVCGRFIRLSGWLHGLHVCLTDAEAKEARRG